MLECKATSSSELIITWKKDGSPLGSGPNPSPSPDKSVLTIIVSSSQDAGYYTCVVEGKKKPSQTKESGPVEIKVIGKYPLCHQYINYSIHVYLHEAVCNFGCMYSTWMMYIAIWLSY